MSIWLMQLYFISFVSNSWELYKWHFVLYPSFLLCNFFLWSLECTCFHLLKARKASWALNIANKKIITGAKINWYGKVAGRNVIWVIYCAYLRFATFGVLGGSKNTNFQNSMGALSNPIFFAIRISKHFLFSFQLPKKFSTSIGISMGKWPKK